MGRTDLERRVEGAAVSGNVDRPVLYDGGVSSSRPKMEFYALVEQGEDVELRLGGHIENGERLVACGHFLLTRNRGSRRRFFRHVSAPLSYQPVIKTNPLGENVVVLPDKGFDLGASVARRLAKLYDVKGASLVFSS